ncbi:MAG: antibiotic biosynthesis monooxygenase [Deltaproteobacteria bacterium]|nr:antibiotic biosynthesis monooxygenase [Deltaproteobacteria bacterium]
MAIKVLISRNIKPNKANEMSALFKEMRYKAMDTVGYISGETLREYNNPNHYLIISTWRSIEDWNNWFNSSQRKEMMKKIEPLLEGPTKIELFVYP